MKLGRRGFLAALFAPLVARFAPKPKKLLTPYKSWRNARRTLPESAVAIQQQYNRGLSTRMDVLWGMGAPSPEFMVRAITDEERARREWERHATNAVQSGETASVKLASVFILLIGLLLAQDGGREIPPHSGPDHKGQPSFCQNTDHSGFKHNCSCKAMTDSNGQGMCDGDKPEPHGDPQCKTYCRRNRCFCANPCEHETR